MPANELDSMHIASYRIHFLGAEEHVVRADRHVLQSAIDTEHFS